MSKVAIKYGATNISTNQGNANRGEMNVFDLSVSDTTGDQIVYNPSVIGTLNRSTAKRSGKMVLFSFVFSNSNSIAANTTFFSVDSTLCPGSQIDFVCAHYSTSANTTTPVRVAITSNGEIFAYDTQDVGNTRGELIWFIEQG